MLLLSPGRRLSSTAVSIGSAELLENRGTEAESTLGDGVGRLRNATDGSLTDEELDALQKEFQPHRDQAASDMFLLASTEVFLTGCASLGPRSVNTAEWPLFNSSVALFDEIVRVTAG